MTVKTVSAIAQLLFTHDTGRPWHAATEGEVQAVSDLAVRVLDLIDARVVATREPPALSVGDAVWVFCENHRVYVDRDGVKHSGSIWREHWVRQRVVSLTTRSYVLSSGVKLQKGAQWMGVVTSERELDEACWVHEHAQAIALEMARRGSYEQLARVAREVSYASSGV